MGKVKKAVVTGIVGVAAIGAFSMSRTSTYKPIVATVPGAINVNVTQANISQTICVSGYTAGIRPGLESYKLKLMKEMGYTDSPNNYELDHEISLEIGGSPNDPSNLWLEPQPRAREVDKIEDQLHRDVCSSKITLKAAQDQIVKIKHTSG